MSALWPRTAPSQLLLAWTLLGFAVFAQNGDGPWALPLVLAAFALAVVAVRAADRSNELVPAVGNAARRSSDAAPSELARLLPLLLAALGLTNALADPGVALGDAARWPFRLGAVLTAAIAVLVVQRGRRAGLALAAAGAITAIQLATGALILRDAPAPHIDVFTLQQGGARALLDGKDPYEATYPNPYDASESSAFFGKRLSDLTHYPYPPLTLLATTASYGLSGDVRWAILLGEIALAWALFLLALRTGLAPPVATGLLALSLLHPRGLFVLEMAWTEPLVGAVAVVALLALCSDRSSWRGGIALGVALAAKQYSVLFLPLLLSTRWLSRRRLAIALAVAAALLVPFFLWGPRGFLDDVALFQFSQPFRIDSLSVPAVLALLTGFRLPGVIGFVAAAAALAWCYRKLPAGPLGIALGGGLAFLAFFLTAKQAFCNYYYFVGALLLAAVALSPQAAEARASRPDSFATGS